MPIRPATHVDRLAIWAILEPVICAGETYALDREMGEGAALDYWTGADREAFVLEEDGIVLGTFYLRANQAGGGAHVGNAGFATAAHATGRGVARRMCGEALDLARARGFRAMQFNFVVASNVRAVALWKSMGFAEVGRVPKAFAHPSIGFVDALILHRDLSQHASS